MNYEKLLKAKVFQPKETPKSYEGDYEFLRNKPLKPKKI
jgi:hypothetical protein